MTWDRAQALHGAVDARQRILVRNLQVVDALLGVHAVDGTAVGLRALLRLRSYQPHEYLLVRPTPVGRGFGARDFVGPPRHGLASLDNLSVVIDIVVVVPRAPCRGALVTDAGVDTHPPLPLLGDKERLDDVNVGVIVGEDLADEDVMGPDDVSVVPMLRQARELIEVVCGEIRIVERRSLDASITSLPMLPAVRVDESLPQPVVAIRIEQPQAFSRAAVLAQPALKFDEELLLHLLALIHEIQAEVVVLELLRVVER